MNLNIRLHCSEEKMFNLYFRTGKTIKKKFEISIPKYIKYKPNECHNV